MARIFISHAHADRDLAMKLVTLLKNALGLRGAQDVFCSSREGAGVTPGAEIREEVVQQIKSASSLIVLVTPLSVGSPWLWFEAGARIAAESQPDPLFAVPADRFKTLPGVVGDRRGVSLDNANEIHELVSEVARQLQTSPDLPAYGADVDELTTAVRRKYSRFNERRLNALRWATTHALLLLVLGIGAAAAWAGVTVRARSAAAQQAKDDATLAANQKQVQAAARFLKWEGQLLSSGLTPPEPSSEVPGPCVESAQKGPGQSAISNAVVLAWNTSADEAKGDPASCLAPKCARDTTSGDGRFEIDLAKINVNQGDSILLFVKPPQHDWISCRLNINVNAEGRTTPVANPLQRLTVTPGTGGTAAGTNVGLH